MAKELTATHKDYTISIESNGSIIVMHNGITCKNTKDALRTIAHAVSFAYDKAWNTRQFGDKLVKFLNENKHATDQSIGRVNQTTPPIPASYKMPTPLNNTGDVIVLNRMYCGDYIDENLGHEVINMFQADDGKHYLYLNARGNLVGDGVKAKHMLLVAYLGEKKVEIVGLAKNLTPIDSAICTLPREMAQKTENGEEQINFIKTNNICYGEASLLEIFNDANQQEIFISYIVDEFNFFEPKKRLILCFNEEGEIREINNIIYIPLTMNFGSTTLHQYVKEIASKNGNGTRNNNFCILNKIIEDTQYWEISNKKVDIKEIYKPWKSTLFDICQIQNDENCFSNALRFFMLKYPDLWRNFFRNKMGIDIDNFSISREEYAKINGEGIKKPTGGRIDLLIRGSKKNSKETVYIIIENKIKSSIIEDTYFDSSQLERYWNYVKHINNNSNRNIFGFVLTPNYNKQQLKDFNNGEIYYQSIYYSEICEYLEDNNFYVEKDYDFNSFYIAMKRHSKDSESLSLYEVMKQKFFTRISKKQSIK